MPPLPLLAYIARVKSYRECYKTYREDLTQRGFPCIISNELENPDQSAQEIINNKFLTLTNPSNAFFLFFPEDSKDDNCAIFELGLCCAYLNTCNICIIGPRDSTKLILPTGVNYYGDWENFIYRRFFS